MLDARLYGSRDDSSARASSAIQLASNEPVENRKSHVLGSSLAIRLACDMTTRDLSITSFVWSSACSRLIVW